MTELHDFLSLPNTCKVTAFPAIQVESSCVSVILELV